MPSVSNGQFLPLLPAPPLPGSGWSVNVISHTDFLAWAKKTNPTPLARISRFQSLSWSPEIGDTGAGTITLALNDPVFSYPLATGATPDSLWRQDNLWVVYEDGQWRGEFIGNQVTFAPTPQTEAAGRTVTISGPGAAGTLAWASVLSPYYPRTTPKGKNGVYQYKNLPVMAAWLQLLRANQTLGFVPWVHCRFSATKDTGGAKWEDTPAPKPKNTATTVVGDVSFDFNSTALNTGGKKAVAVIAAKLAAVTYPQVTITGHTDSVGTIAHNYQQGLDRANTVANAILAIRPLAQVSTASKGETQPIASNRTAAGRAKNRRVVVTYQTASAYVDTIYTPERGTTLLDLLKQLTSGQTTAENRGPIHCEWLMGKGFELMVRSQIGTDRSAAVVYHEGDTFLASRGTTVDRSGIANVVAVQNDLTAYKVATSPASITTWGRRMKYVRVEGSYADPILTQIAGNQLLAGVDPLTTGTISIVAGPGRTPFVDYGLGDWIGVWSTRGKLRGSVDKQRVMAITVTVDSDGRATYELTLNTTRQTKVAWLLLQIDALINRKKGVRAFIQDDEPTGGLPGDLWTPPQTFTGNV